MRDDTSLLSLAAQQHGLAHQIQLRQLGFNESAIRHRVEHGRWVRRTPSILQLAGSPETVQQRLMLAALDVGLDSALSFDTAAARWGIPGFSLEPVHVTGDRQRGRRDNHLAKVHQPRLLLPEHVLVLDGIRTTSPTRTLFDLAGVLHPGRLERALDTALASGLTTIPLLRKMLKQLARKGRPGIRIMRELLEARPLGYRPPESGLESRFQRLARQAGIWTFERQVDVGDEYDWIGRVDFIERSKRVIVEVQSARFHGSVSDQRRDAKRRALLRAAGWKVIEVREHDLWHNPEKVIRDLYQAFFW